LHAPNHSLVDHISVLESVPLSSDVEPFRSMMAAALELIAAVHPTLAAQIENIIGWYVPVRTNDIKTHRSFTVERMPGVMFLSEAIDPAILAEAIVHEFYHTVLHVVTETEDVFGTVDPQQKFYSPWRDDPRPLPGLFHAIYVFSGVVEFYARAERVLEPGQLAIVHQRQGKLQQQLRMAMAQIPRSQLAPAGDRIMTRIENLLAACPLVAIDSSAQQTMESHLLAWSQSNPALAAQVRRPEA
jgi:HEXXH motif-containing protein